ncbi:MAG TPA: hypothetical protein VN903_19240 [Polyangia bacterium]|jgi:hypothetical protein|nr:hypothetical protein [Polyangia bacterium]
MHAQTVETHGGRALMALMVVLMILTAVSLLMVFRPRRQSSFSEAGGYGPGHGSESLMFGASPRKGAAR